MISAAARVRLLGVLSIAMLLPGLLSCMAAGDEVAVAAPSSQTTP